MTIADDVQGVLPELRYQAASLMVDRADIVRPGASVFDPATGTLTPSESTIYEDQPCRVRMPAAVEVERLFGEEQVTTTRYVASFSHDTVGVRVGDVVRVTRSDDADVLARDFRVVAVPATSWTHSKSFGCEVVE